MSAPAKIVPAPADLAGEFMKEAERFAEEPVLGFFVMVLRPDTAIAFNRNWPRLRDLGGALLNATVDVAKEQLEHSE